MEALAHPAQDDRLRALGSYGVLDTDREKDFDEIANLAATLCGTPIGVVNLIDRDRQWFKAEVGLGTRSTPIETSICAHTILQHDLVEVPDTLKDPRFVDNPLCLAEPGLRFYAGVVLVTPEGLPLGTLCVLDYRPRELTEVQRQTLRVLARQVMVQLEMRKALRSAKLMRQEVDHRVKNSLQALSSFARLQARSLTSDDARVAVERLQARMEAVAALHEALYQSDSASAADLGDYLRNLCQHMAGTIPPNVQLDLDFANVRVTPQQAVAVGTMVNEFVANSLKHAFPDRRDGTIRIVTRVDADGMVAVTCADDGIGLTEEAMAERAPGVTDGLGMKIVQVICAELQCELDFSNSDRGVQVAFAFRPG